MSSEPSTKTSISMPRSMLRLAQKRLKREYPPRTFSRLVQDLIAEDLREVGILPASQTNKTRERKGELVNA